MIKYNKFHKNYMAEVGDRAFYYARGRYGKYAKDIAKLSVINGCRINNYYTMYGDYTVMKVYSKIHGYFDIRYDTEMHDIVSKYYWHVVKRGNTFYCETNYLKDCRKRIRLHNLVTNCPEGFYVDHYDRNGLNCVKSNLIVSDKSLRGMNVDNGATNKFNFPGIYRCGNNVQIMGRWRDGDKVMRKSFSISKYGYDIALAKAIVHKYEASIDCGYIYDEEQYETYLMMKNEVEDIV